MTTRDELQEWVVEALRFYGGKASVVEVCKYVWECYESDLRDSGDLLYTWQYDVRWAAQKLRDSGVLKKVHGERTRPWELAEPPE